MCGFLEGPMEWFGDAISSVVEPVVENVVEPLGDLANQYGPAAAMAFFNPVGGVASAYGAGTGLAAEGLMGTGAFDSMGWAGSGAAGEAMGLNAAGTAMAQSMGPLEMLQMAKKAKGIYDMGNIASPIAPPYRSPIPIPRAPAPENTHPSDADPEVMASFGLSATPTTAVTRPTGSLVHLASRDDWSGPGTDDLSRFRIPGYAAGGPIKPSVGGFLSYIANNAVGRDDVFDQFMSTQGLGRNKKKGLMQDSINSIETRTQALNNLAGGGPPIGPPGTRDTHHVLGSGGGQDDVIDAKLAPGEYIFDAESVSNLGDGNNAEGAKKLDKMRINLREHKRGGPLSQIPPKAKKPEKYLAKR